MKLPLYRKITLHTQLTKDQVRQVILENTTPRDNTILGVFNKQPSTKFKGFLYKDYFRIERVITYWNSFIPLISGQLNTLPNGTEVTLTFKPYAFVVVFIIIWTGILLFATAITFINGINHDTLTKEALIPIGMLIFGSILFTTLFNSEFDSAKEELIKILKSPEKD